MAESDPAVPGPVRVRQEDFRSVTLDPAHLRSRKIVGLNGTDSRSRAFSLLRTRFAKAAEESGARLIGITSPTPAAGKSFLSVNLALSLAKVATGPVCLVDLDLRRASIAEELGLNNPVGIDDFLADRVQSIEEIGLSVDGLPLVLFPTRRVDTDTSGLLAGSNFERLIQGFRDRSNGAIVLFDLPPAFANDDAMISVAKMDAYVLVADSRNTNKAHVLESLSMFEPTPCIGTVLNFFLGGVLDKYGYGSGGYGKYYGS